MLTETSFHMVYLIWLWSDPGTRSHYEVLCLAHYRGYARYKPDTADSRKVKVDLGHHDRDLVLVTNRVLKGGQ